jgi:hypothetical protein
VDARGWLLSRLLVLVWRRPRWEGRHMLQRLSSLHLRVLHFQKRRVVIRSTAVQPVLWQRWLKPQISPELPPVSSQRRHPARLLWHREQALPLPQAGRRRLRAVPPVLWLWLLAVL